MNPIVFENGAVEIDAAIVAEALGIASRLLLERMRAARSAACANRGSTRIAAGTG